MTLTPAEEKLLGASNEGQFAQYSSADPAANDPEHGGSWGSERTIRAEIIYALAVGAIDSQVLSRSVCTTSAVPSLNRLAICTGGCT